MIVVEGHRGPWRDRLVFFPDQREAEELRASVSTLEVVRIRQTEADLLPGRGVVERRIFRTSRIDLRVDEETLLGDVQRTGRNEIRRIEGMGDRIRYGRNDPRARSDFLSLYRKFVAAKGHHHPMSASRLADYARVADVWVAYVDDAPMLARLFIRDPASGVVRFLYEGNRRFEGAQVAKLGGMLGRAFHWHLMTTYRHEGYARYDMGGIGDGGGPVARFKLSMGGIPVEDHSYVLAGSMGAVGFRGFTALERLRGDLRRLSRRLRH